jgi:hypothetical protein
MASVTTHNPEEHNSNISLILHCMNKNMMQHPWITVRVQRYPVRDLKQARKKSDIKLWKQWMPTYISFPMWILHSIIIPQLVFYEIKNKPTLFPAFEQNPTLVEITFMCTVFCHIGQKLVIVLLTGCLDCCNAYKKETDDLFIVPCNSVYAKITSITLGFVC